MLSKQTKQSTRISTQVLLWGEILFAGNTLDNCKTFALEMQMSKETFLPSPPLPFFL